MKYECGVSKRTSGYGKKLKNKHLDENYKMLKQTYFKSATGREPTATYFVNEHSTVWPNWPND